MKHNRLAIHLVSYTVIALGLTACINSSRVQVDYISVRDECRGVAEDNFEFYLPKTQQQGRSATLESKDRNAVLAQIFSDCMYQNGWTVAAPGKRGRGRRPDDLAFLSTPSAKAPTAAAAPAEIQQKTSAAKRPVHRGQAPIGAQQQGAGNAPAQQQINAAQQRPVHRGQAAYIGAQQQGTGNAPTQQQINAAQQRPVHRGQAAYIGAQQQGAGNAPAQQQINAVQCPTHQGQAAYIGAQQQGAGTAPTQQQINAAQQRPVHRGQATPLTTQQNGYGSAVTQQQTNTAQCPVHGGRVAPFGTQQQATPLPRPKPRQLIQQPRRNATPVPATTVPTNRPALPQRGRSYEIYAPLPSKRQPVNDYISYNN